jgi:hypothetical protein
MSLLQAASIFYYKIKTITREMEVEWREKNFGFVNKHWLGGT